VEDEHAEQEEIMILHMQQLLQYGMKSPRLYSMLLPLACTQRDQTVVVIGMTSITEALEGCNESPISGRLPRSNEERDQFAI
jgi:hypothetical protein